MEFGNEPLLLVPKLPLGNGHGRGANLVILRRTFPNGIWERVDSAKDTCRRQQLTFENISNNLGKIAAEMECDSCE